MVTKSAKREVGFQFFSKKLFKTITIAQHTACFIFNRFGIFIFTLNELLLLDCVKERRLL